MEAAVQAAVTMAVEISRQLANEDVAFRVDGGNARSLDALVACPLPPALGDLARQRLALPVALLAHDAFHL